MADERPQDFQGTLRQSAEEQSASKGLSVPKEAVQDAKAPKIAGYLLSQPLGKGAFAEVWKAWQVRTRKWVAVKVFTQRNGVNWLFLQREVERLIRLDKHPHIVSLLDADLTGDPAYYVMDLMEGSLDQYVEGGKRPSAEQAARWKEEIAQALAYVHAKGLIHCDLKPANVMLDDEGHVRVADFGQSRIVTESSGALGTLFYMAPEQAVVLGEGQAVQPDVRWDIYGLGTTMHAVLTGRVPHGEEAQRKRLEQAKSLEERLRTYREIVREHPLEPPANGGVSDEELAAMVAKCARPLPEERYTTVAELMEDFKAKAENRPVSPLSRRPGYLIRKLLERNATASRGARVLFILFGLSFLSSVFLTGILPEGKQPDFAAVNSKLDAAVEDAGRMQDVLLMLRELEAAAARVPPGETAAQTAKRRQEIAAYRERTLDEEVKRWSAERPKERAQQAAAEARRLADTGQNLFYLSAGTLFTLYGGALLAMCALAALLLVAVVSSHGWLFAASLAVPFALFMSAVVAAGFTQVRLALILLGSSLASLPVAFLMRRDLMVRASMTILWAAVCAAPGLFILMTGQKEIDAILAAFASGVLTIVAAMFVPARAELAFCAGPPPMVRLLFGPFSWAARQVGLWLARFPWVTRVGSARFSAASFLLLAAAFLASGLLLHARSREDFASGRALEATSAVRLADAKLSRAKALEKDRKPEAMALSDAELEAAYRKLPLAKAGELPSPVLIEHRYRELKAAGDRLPELIRPVRSLELLAWEAEKQADGVQRALIVLGLAAAAAGMLASALSNAGVGPDLARLSWAGMWAAAAAVPGAVALAYALPDSFLLAGDELRNAFRLLTGSGAAVFVAALFIPRRAARVFAPSQTPPALARLSTAGSTAAALLKDATGAGDLLVEPGGGIALAPGRFARHLALAFFSGGAIYSVVGLGAGMAPVLSGAGWGKLAAVGLGLALAAYGARAAWGRLTRHAAPEPEAPDFSRLDRLVLPVVAILLARALCLVAGALAAMPVWDLAGSAVLSRAKAEVLAAGYHFDMPRNRPRPKEEDNAAFWIAKATAAWSKETPFEPKDADSKQFYQRAAAGTLTAGDLDWARHLVAPQAAVAGPARTAASKAEAHWGIDYDSRPAVAIRIPHLGDLRRLRDYLTMKAVVDAHEGRSQEAIDTLRDALAIARMPASEPLALFQLVSAAGAVRVLEGARAVLPKVPAGDAARAWSPHLDLDRLGPGLRETLVHDRFGMMSFMEEISLLGGGWDKLAWLHGPQSIEAPIGRFWDAMVLYIPFFKLDLASYYRGEIARMRAFEAPVLERRAASQRAQEDFEKSAWLHAQTLAASFASMADRIETAQAHAGLARLALEAKAFRQRSGRWPASMSDLAAGLKDPFGGGAFRLKAEGTGIRVYSVGPDGKDDGGAPFDESTRKGDLVWELR